MTRPRRWAAIALAALLVPSTLVVGSSPASAADTGYVDFSYVGTTAPTGQKPQSKLWFADGRWWGALFNTVTRDFEIYRYDVATHTWTSTNVLVDERTSSYLDALWDGQHLYVATAGTSASTSAHAARIVRFTYDPATATYTRDAGFPVTITNGGVKSIVLAKDSAGVLWTTWTGANKVWVAHSTTSDATWTSPYVLPVAGATGIGTDEISSVVAYDGDRLGLMWSNQPSSTMYFATHVDGAPGDAWTVEAAYSRPEGADDHINLKSLTADAAGRVFAVTKTSFDAPTDPLIHVLVLGLDGTWSSHVFGTHADDHTRAIVAIDRDNRELYVFASAPCCSGGVIYYKKAPLDAIEFEPGLGTPFIASGTHTKLNNPTSTKQVLDAQTGVLVMAGDDDTRTYMHNYVALGAPPADSEPPTVVATSPSDGAVGAALSAPVTADFSEALDPATVTTETVTLVRASDDAPVAATVEYDTVAHSVRLHPDDALSPLTAYRAVVRGGPTGITDPAGNPLTADVTWTFTTGEGWRFTDDFETGTLDRWDDVVTRGDGTVAVEQGAGVGSSFGARLTSFETPKSVAYVRRVLTAPESSVTFEASVRFLAEGTAGSAPFMRVLDAAGNRLATLQRRAESDRLQLFVNGTAINTSVLLPVGDGFRRIALRVVIGGGSSHVDVIVDGVVVRSEPTSATASPAIVQLGDDARKQRFDIVADDVLVTRDTGS